MRLNERYVDLISFLSSSVSLPFPFVSLSGLYFPSACLHNHATTFPKMVSLTEEPL